LAKVNPSIGIAPPSVTRKPLIPALRFIRAMKTWAKTHGRLVHDQSGRTLTSRSAFDGPACPATAASQERNRSSTVEGCSISPAHGTNGASCAKLFQELFRYSIERT
jgi:hypothetical protein